MSQMPPQSAFGSAKARVAVIRTADVLSELSGEVEALGASLCADPQVTACHINTLQQIDIIAQKLQGLANLLAADCPVSAVSDLSLESLRDRFDHLAVKDGEQAQQIAAQT